MMAKKEDKKSKDQRSDSQDIQQHRLGGQNSHHVDAHSILHIIDGDGLSKVSCCGGLTYVIFGVITIILALVEIVICSFGAATQKYYDGSHTGRMASMIFLAVVAAIVLGLVVYAIVGVHRKHSKPLHSAAIVLGVLMLIQALIAGIAVNISEYDEHEIGRLLAESFYRAKDGDPDQAQLWDKTQSGLECCGLYSPEDYRDPYAPFNFPPSVPASCCPSFKNAEITGNSVEKERELCRTNNNYYKIGCKLPVEQIVYASAISVVAVTVLLIVAEVLLAILGGILSTKRKREKHNDIDVYYHKHIDIPVPATQ